MVDYRNVPCVKDPDAFEPPKEVGFGNTLTPAASRAVLACLSCVRLPECRTEIKNGEYEGVEGIIGGLATSQRRAIEHGRMPRYLRIGTTS